MDKMIKSWVKRVIDLAIALCDLCAGVLPGMPEKAQKEEGHDCGCDRHTLAISKQWLK